MSVVLVAAFVAILDSFIVIVAGPAIRADLGATDAELQWVLAAYQLTYAVFLVTGGRLGDLVGRRRMFVAGMALFTVSSVACALAPTVGVLVAARLVQGLGTAAMLPQVYAVIVEQLGQAQRHRAFGVLGVVIGMATIGGQLVGGVLVGADLLGTGWRSVFWVNVPIGVAAVAAARRWLPPAPAGRARRLDVPGVAVLSAALVLLCVPLIQGREAGWPWWAWAGLAGSAVAFAAFVGVERRSADPLLAPSLFGIRSFSVGIALVLAIYACLTSYYLVLSVALQEGLGMDALGAGLVYAPAAVTFFVFSMVASRLVPRFGRRVLEVGSVVLVLGYAATALVLLGGLPFTPAVVVPTLVLQSVGGGLLITPSLNAVLARVGPEAAGSASGALSTAQQVGGALGVALVGVVFYGAFEPATPGSAAHALGVSSLFTCGTAVLATVLVFLLPRVPGVRAAGTRVVAPAR